ncbi:peptidase [Rhodoferax koreense]|uniref:Probable periplasmic serine endoprotease DegP-like n=1 Tax=Rhodoferax koreensis TaxID=1842727 RepID=A0A1P8JZF8_9BURK|nr:Do family serine endopeptidase [Rhodoferax koreense]APW39134.1 peptidase [Rhodoferax koreense]
MSNVSLKSTKLVLALVAAGAIGGAGVGLVQTGMAHAAAPVVATAPAVAGVPMALPDFSQITAQYGPAVVNISVTSVASDEDKAEIAQQQGGQEDPFGNDPFFEFFKRFQGQQGQQPGRAQRNAPPQMVRGQGSGFIVGADGTILTNAHVVRGAKEVTVKLTDRREYQAKVLGSDPKTDIAVLKIDAKNLPVVNIGKVSDLRVGEWVLAIGSPFGFENTVTAGVVSAKNRSLPDDSSVSFIQTDVAVNPGNSGGPLFNTRGEVVGINSQIYSRTGGYQGVSFAIPIDLASKIKDQIVAHGKVEHARLGVAVQEVNQTLADSFKLDKPEGALVSAVDKNGPAAKAGLEPGDVIRKVNGQAIVSSGDLPSAISLSTPGETVKLDVWRKGGPVQIEAKLGSLNDKATKVANSDEGAQKGKLGLALRQLEPDELRSAGLPSGLLIEEAAGAAANAGVAQGDVLLAVNGTPVKSVEQVRAAVAKSDKSVALLIQRGGDKIFVPVRLG